MIRNKSGIVFSDEEKKYIIDEYTTNSRTSLLKLAKEFNVDSSTIKKLLLNNGVTHIKNNSEIYTIRCNDNFFEKIDSENKAYVFGFFCADGCITREKYFHFSISPKDIEILYKIKHIMDFCGDVHIYTSNQKNSFCDVGYEYATLTICSRKIVLDLMNLGITYDKTHGLCFNAQCMEPELIHHFIRGFFDGDGSVFSYKINKMGKIYDTIGASIIGKKDFLFDMCSYIPIRKLNGSLPIYSSKKQMWCYQVSGKKRCLQLYNYLYKDATIFLQRKKNKFEKLLEEYSKNISK